MQKLQKKGSIICAYYEFFSILIVVRWVVHMENRTIATGNNASVSHPPPDSPSIAIKPTRALWAVDIISSNTGVAAIKPIVAAVALIFATIICIWWAMKLSDAPI